jgi:hypothetical protein
VTDDKVDKGKKVADGVGEKGDVGVELAKLNYGIVSCSDLRDEADE